MSDTTPDLGSIASSVDSSFTNLTKLITAGSYLAGLGFSIGAIMKFKQHKDNPTQIPVGTPVALVFIAAALLFLPTILGTTGDGSIQEKLEEAEADPEAAAAKAASAASSAGITSSDVAAAESTAKEKLTS